MSILVDVRDGSAARVDRSLDSARAQPGPDLEILPLGSGDVAVAEVVARHAAEDWRVRRTGTPGGRSVLCLAAGDELLPGSVDALVGLLAADPGADVAVGAVTGPGHAPEAVVPAVLGRALWRRAWWQRLPLHGPAPVAYARGVRQARSVASTAVPVLRRGGPDVPMFGAMPDPRPDLDRWLDEQTVITDLLDGAELATAWCAAALTEAERFLDASERLDARQWALLQGAVQGLVEGAGDALAHVPVEARVKAWLAATGDRVGLEAFDVARRLEDGQFPTVVRGGQVHADLGVDVPDELLVLSEGETPLRGSLRGARLVDADTVELRLFVLVDRVGLEHHPDIAVRLVGAAGPVDLDVTPEADPEATRFGGSRWHDQDRAAVRCRVPSAAVVEALDGTLPRLEATTTVGGVRRTGPVAHHDPGAGLEPFFRRLAGAARAAHPELTGLEVRGGVLHAEGTWAGPAPAAGVLRLRHPRVTLTGPARFTDDGGFTAEVPLRADEWGLGEAAAPSGRYRVELEPGTSDGSPPNERRLGTESVTARRTHRAQLRTWKGGAQEVLLAAPLTDDELGPYRQQRLQRWYADGAAGPVDPRRVYFQAYTGQVATDSPLAIHDELRRRPGSEDLDLVWAVADESAWTPDGARRVLWRSREWYAALATAGSVVTNIELERWYRSRPGQRVLQTFHGYPSKTMGIGLWRAKGFTDSRVEQQLDRTSRNWDLLLTPAPEMDVHYREQYRYDGEILAAGYPRDDLLVSPEADAVRAAARARLGIAAGQTAVLYAPTWRDDLATNHRSVRMGDHLELGDVAEALGASYVVLVRGHRFHAREAARRSGGSSRLVDVTDYPEINHLVLAADAAVLDYSSLRFDVALTGIPMVFLVPDLDDYTGGVRGFLYDFRDTAPGPLARTQAEVVAALRDLDAVRVAHQAAYRRFNEAYNHRQDGHAAARVVDAFFPGGP